MASYAPLLAHVDGRTALTDAPPPWHAMIYFDGTRVFGTASYYLWKLFGTNRPDQMVKADVEFANVEPPTIAGQIGVGTWAAMAEFKDIRVERSGEVLYESDFAQNAEGWEPERGRRSRRSTWQVQDGVYRQDREGYALSYFGDDSWSDYTLSLKARKLSGNEGFLIVFGRKEGGRYWWNLGGWGNSQHAIELNQSPVGRPVRGRIKSDRWYDIKIELAANRIRCFLDGELIHDVESTPPETFFVNAGREDSSGDLIVKTINIAPEPVRAQVRVNGAADMKSTAKTIVLRSSSLEDNNSLEEPNQVVPKEEALDLAGLEFAHEFPQYSLTVLRVSSSQAK
jgi:alpha-L-arabinofuranosidase